MSTTCPNCNHSVRKDARYCGFCGANLTSPAQIPSARPANTASNPYTKKAKLVKPRRFKTRQVVTFTAIALLVLVIVLAVTGRYWTEISQGLIQFLFSAYVRIVSH